MHLLVFKTLSAYAREGYSTQFVCRSVTQQKVDLEDDSLPKMKQASKCSTGHFKYL